MKIPYGLKKVATLCVLKNENQFLLLERLKEPNKGMLTPIGGKLEPHESPLQAAIRETFEEVGITVPSMSFCGLLSESSPVEYNWTNYVYLAEIDYQDPPYCNEGTLHWVQYDEILNVATPKTDWYIYDCILKKKPFHFNAIFNEDIQLQQMTEEMENKVVYKA